MSDITMCTGGAEDSKQGIICEIRDKCYRHTATQNPFRQSWFMFIPLVIVDGKQHCDEFSTNT